MENNKSPKINIGGVSIVVIFCVLCLSVFSVLALLSANSEKKLTVKSVQAMQNYYMADVSCAKVAQTVTDLYLSGAADKDIEDYVLSVFGTFGRDGDSLSVSYSWKIDVDQEIFVDLSLAHSKVRVNAWNIRYVGDWEIDDSIEVWDGFFPGDLTSEEE